MASRSYVNSIAASSLRRIDVDENLHHAGASAVSEAIDAVFNWIAGVDQGLHLDAPVGEELEHLAKLVAEAEALGIDPWPKEKPPRPWAKFALASFMIIMMLSWVSRWMYRFVEV